MSDTRLPADLPTGLTGSRRGSGGQKDGAMALVWRHDRLRVALDRLIGPVRVRQRQRRVALSRAACIVRWSRSARLGACRAASA